MNAFECFFAAASASTAKLKKVLAHRRSSPVLQRLDLLVAVQFLGGHALVRRPPVARVLLQRLHLGGQSGAQLVQVVAPLGLGIQLGRLLVGHTALLRELLLELHLRLQQRFPAGVMAQGRCHLPDLIALVLMSLFIASVCWHCESCLASR